MGCSSGDVESPVGDIPRLRLTLPAVRALPREVGEHPRHHVGTCRIRLELLETEAEQQRVGGRRMATTSPVCCDLEVAGVRRGFPRAGPGTVQVMKLVLEACSVLGLGVLRRTTSLVSSMMEAGRLRRRVGDVAHHHLDVRSPA